MWQKPFGYSEYILIGGGLTLTGVMLQITVGAIDWSLVAFPANVVLLCLLMAVIVGMHLLRKRVYMFRCLSEVRMAVVALSFVAALTFVMGMIRQDGASMGMSPHLSLGFRNMLHAWWLVLPYLWLTVCLGLTAMRRTFPFHFRNIPFLLNHWGLFLVLVCGTLGSADIQQFTLQAYPHKPEWRAVDDKGAMHELPLAIELQQFSMEEYPARMMVIDNGSGKAQPEKGPQTMTTDEKKGKILDWQITINRYMDYSAPVETKDTVNYVGWGSSGATESALVTVTNIRTHQQRRGWISCGSYLFPFHVLALDKRTSLVMAEREPKKFASAVKVYTKDEEVYLDSIMVNKPLDAMGWKIYQLDYDKEKGRWSELSVFKLVRDPWLPAVYVGLFMMLAGAVLLFLGHEKSES
jgi:hypothetical protein